jgi:hypothetical protein
MAQVKSMLAEGVLDTKIQEEDERRALGATRDFVIPDIELGSRIFRSHFPTTSMKL